MVALDVYGDIWSNGSNAWRIHTPDDGRISLWFGRGSNGSVAEWPFEFRAGGTMVASAFLYSSDARLKEGVVAIQDGAQKGKEDIGFIAQEVEAIVPEVVYTDSDGIKSIDYIKLVPILVQALHEQQAEIEELKALVENQERRIQTLEAKLSLPAAANDNSPAETSPNPASNSGSTTAWRSLIQQNA